MVWVSGPSGYCSDPSRCARAVPGRVIWHAWQGDLLADAQVQGFSFCSSTNSGVVQSDLGGQVRQVNSEYDHSDYMDICIIWGGPLKGV